MKTLTNQLRAILAAVIMLITSLPALAYNFVDNGFYYNVIDETAKTVEVTYWYNEYSGSITIPPSVPYNGITYSVTSISYQAFDGCTGLTSINIPNSVTSIGDRVFRVCTGLTSITIPNSVTKIGDEAFFGCSGLTDITIPNSVTSIGNEAFYDCTGLTSIVVAKGNSKYDSRDNCNAIIETETNRLIAGCKNTIIPNSVTSIGDRAFYCSTGLTSITIPNSVTEIGEWAFLRCTGLKSITIPNSVTSIGKSAFRGCTNLKTIIIQNPDVEIGIYAIPKGVEVIIEK